MVNSRRYAYHAKYHRLNEKTRAQNGSAADYAANEVAGAVAQEELRRKQWRKVSA